MIRAVVFDLDGVLLDTERIAVRSWIDAARDLGIDLPREKILATVGLDWNRTSDAIRRAVRSEDAFDALRDRVLRIRSERFAGGVPAKPGARRILRFLSDRGVPIGVATGTARPLAEARLAALGYDRYIDAMACGDEVANGKPDPEIYVLAASRLSVLPEECIALEDSPAGLASAQSAGLATLHIPDRSVIARSDPRTCRSACSCHADDLSAAIPLLVTLCFTQAG